MIFCARNARPQKALVGRAQWKINQPPSLDEVTRASSEGSFRRFVLAIVKRRLAQQLVPFRLIVERNVEQAAPPVRTGRGASLWQEPQQGSDARSGRTTILGRIERVSLEGRVGAASDVLLARGTRALRRASFGAHSGGKSEATLWGEGNERAWKEYSYSHRRSESAIA